jgi:hypothetical protein
MSNSKYPYTGNYKSRCMQNQLMVCKIVKIILIILRFTLTEKTDFLFFKIQGKYWLGIEISDKICDAHKLHNPKRGGSTVLGKPEDPKLKS